MRFKRLMSDWEYDQFIDASWNQEFELYAPGERKGPEAAELCFYPDGTIGVGVSGGCYSCSGMNRRYADLTLEQAIELSTWLDSTMIPKLMEKESG